MPVSLEQFRRQLIESGLVSKDEIQTALDTLSASGVPPSGDQLANALVNQQLLTRFQVDQIVAGKGRALVLGNYVILDQIGQGGMGLVMKARHRRMDRVVALKLMSASAMHSPASVQRFHREAKAAAKLTHPNIVIAFDADEAQGTHFLVMEYVAGEDLAAYVRNNGPLPVEHAVSCILQAARGLEYAHQQGVVHRDIKPANLLIDSNGAVKILDLGLARIDAAFNEHTDQPGLTSSATILGTVDYMSPEQAMDTKRADARSDIYSLGCSLYYLLTGRSVFQGDTMMKRLMAHQQAPVPSLAFNRAVAPGLAEPPTEAFNYQVGAVTREPTADAPCNEELWNAVNAVFLRMVAKDPGDRPQSMREVIVELERCFPAGTPATALWQPSTARRFVTSVTPHNQPDSRSGLADGDGNDGTVSTGLTDDSQLTFIARPAVKPDSAGTSVDQPVPAPESKPPRPAEHSTHPEQPLLNSTGRSPFTMSRLRWVGLITGVVSSAVAVFAIVAAMNGNGKQPQGPDSQAGTASSTSSVGPGVAAVEPKQQATWEMGPEPTWFSYGGHSNPFHLRDGPVLPGVIERPRKIPGIKRWNVDGVSSRGDVQFVRYSPDGKWIASGSRDGHVRIHHSQTLKLQILLPGIAHRAGVVDVAWHPDSQRIAVIADEQFALRVFHLDGQLEWEQVGDSVKSGVAWNRAGTRIALGLTSDRDRGMTIIKLLDAAGNLERRIEMPTAESKMNAQSGIYWSPDDKHLLVRHEDNQVRIWDLSTGQSRVLDANAPGSLPHSLAWSSADWIAISTEGGTRLYDPERKLVRTLPTNYDQVEWHPDGRRLLTHGPSGTAVWDRDSGNRINSVYGIGPVLQLGTVATWSPDGERCATGGCQLSVASSDLKELVKTTEVGFKLGIACQWSPDGRLLAVASPNSESLVWDQYGQPQPMILETKVIDPAVMLQSSSAREVVWAADSQFLLGGRARFPGDQFFNVWKRDSSGNVRRFFHNRDASDENSPTPLCTSPDGHFLLIGESMGVIHVLKPDGTRVTKLQTGGKNPWSPIAAWNPVTNLIAILDLGQPLQFCDPKQDWKLRTVRDQPLLFEHYIHARWSPDGKWLSTGGGGWFDQTGQPIPNRPPWGAVAWRSDGSECINPTSDVGIHDHQGLVLRNRDSNHSNSYAHAWHPKGQYIAQVSQHSLLTIWRADDLQPHWHALFLPNGHSATFSNAGELLTPNHAVLDPYLVYYVDKGDGRIENLTPSEFRKLLFRLSGQP